MGKQKAMENMRRSGKIAPTFQSLAQEEKDPERKYSTHRGFGLARYRIGSSPHHPGRSLHWSIPLLRCALAPSPRLACVPDVTRK